MITKLEERFENAKEKFAKEQTSLIFSKFEAEKILEDTELTLQLFVVAKDHPDKKRLVALHKQLEDFLDLIDGLIELKRGYTI